MKLADIIESVRVLMELQATELEHSYNGDQSVDYTHATEAQLERVGEQITSGWHRVPSDDLDRLIGTALSLGRDQMMLCQHTPDSTEYRACEARIIRLGKDLRYWRSQLSTSQASRKTLNLNSA